MTARPRVCVVGAGVIGLTSAVNIQKALPHAQVTVIAEHFGCSTTSDGAAGLFRLELQPTENKQRFMDWLHRSWRYFDSLVHSKEAALAGASIISGVQVDEEQLEPPVYKDVIYSFRELSDKELSRFGPNIKVGYNMTTIIVEPRFFLPWLLERFKKNGGVTQRRRVSSLEELSEYDVVVNCSGLGAAKLVPDPSMYPSRGQMVRMKAPWIKNFLHWGRNGTIKNYIIPGRETVCVGGIKEPYRWSTAPCPEQRQLLLSRAAVMTPSIAAAEIQWEWVGLRPMRPAIRLEAESRRLDDGKTLHVVHNYGHGSFGVSLCWPCAEDVASLVKRSITAQTGSYTLAKL